MEKDVIDVLTQEQNKIFDLSDKVNALSCLFSDSEINFSESGAKGMGLILQDISANLMDIYCQISDLLEHDIVVETSK